MPGGKEKLATRHKLLPFRYCSTDRVRYPNVGPIKGNPFWCAADKKSPHIVSVTCPQFGYCPVTTVRYPNIGSIENHSPGGSADVKSTEDTAATCLQFAHGIIAEVCHPNVGSIESHSIWLLTHWEGATRLRCPVTRPQFGHCIAEIVCDPDVRAIEGNRGRVGTSGRKGMQERSIAGPYLADRIGEADYPD